MRSLSIAILMLLLSACAEGRAEPEAIARPMAAPVSRGLIGSSMSELVARFGTPQLQVREGPGLKLQWASSGCILDVYLYAPPSGGGIERAVHADARRPSGETVLPGSCVGN